jgi:putative membrane protein
VKSVHRGLWAALAVLVVAQVCYPLTTGTARAILVIATVAGGCALSVWHAVTTRGMRTAAALVTVTMGGGILVEVVGVASGLPFGRYEYTGALGPQIFGVPVVVPLAWTWMAWPAYLVAGRLCRTPVAGVLVAGFALAAWDLFLDPQMVAAGYWRWSVGGSVLPGVPGVPLTNYAGWLAVAVVMMAVLMWTAPYRGGPDDAPMYGLYLWTYYSSVLAHAVFLDLPGSAVWGGVAMGAVAIPLTAALTRSPAARMAAP